MRVLVATTCCSKIKYAEIERDRVRQILGAQQKYFYFLLKGLAAHKDLIVDTLTIPPVSFSSHKKRVWKSESEVVDNINFHYISFVNGRFSRYVTQAKSAAKFIAKWNKQSDDEKVIIVDSLLAHISSPIQKFAKKKKITTIGVVTDLPYYVSEMTTKKRDFRSFFQNIYDKKTYKNLERYDKYIFLTESMNGVLNRKNAPYIVIEGISDTENRDNTPQAKTRVCIYAGGIYEKFGVFRLAEAFSKLDTDWELHIYGAGPDTDRLIKFCNNLKNVKFMGSVPQDKIVDEERKALLLINPRPSNEEFTKYSFPSKTMEYLSSGTAVLSTRLPGIPKEYYNYLYWFDGETVEQMSKKIGEVISLDDESLISFGCAGKEFVTQSKDYISQGNKIASFIYGDLK